jgi:membrane protein DedA with SNARE-associated domain
MKRLTTFLNIIGSFLIVAGILLFSFCAMISDPEIEGESGRTPLSAYLISTTISVIGILLLIVSYKRKKH